MSDEDSEDDVDYRPPAIVNSGPSSNGDHKSNDGDSVVYSEAAESSSEVHESPFHPVSQSFANALWASLRNEVKMEHVLDPVTLLAHDPITMPTFYTGPIFAPEFLQQHTQQKVMIQQSIAEVASSLEEEAALYEKVKESRVQLEARRKETREIGQELNQMDATADAYRLSIVTEIAKLIAAVFPVHFPQDSQDTSLKRRGTLEKQQETTLAPPSCAELEAFFK